MQILVVESDEVIADLFDSSLGVLGHEVVTLGSYSEATTYLETNPCRLVIGGWQANGAAIEFCQQLKSQDRDQPLYFILLVSTESTEERNTALDAGVDDFLTPSCDSDELRQRLQTAERVLSIETREQVIYGLAKLAESRDPETSHHLDRMREYCRTLARQLAQCDKFRGIVDDEYVDLIYLTSPLHDIGKVGIPDGVLLKPGPLTETEFEIMKRHARIGAETLENLLTANPGAKYLQMARDIAWSHHEKFDGSGYPRGLIGSDIPLSGRIVALADVYDALTTKRVYKPAYSHEVSRSIILDGRGKHFDPDVVEAFTKVESEFVEIRSRFGNGAPTEDEHFCTEALLTQ